MAGRRDLPATRRGYNPHEVVSAIQKAIRRSDIDQALYWGFELYQGGYPDWAWKRIRTIVTEDIGPAAPTLTAEIEALYLKHHDFKRKAGRRAARDEGVFWFAHAVILCAMAPKSRIVQWAMFHHGGDHAPRIDIPDEALDKHTLRGARMGRGLDHFFNEGAKLIQPDDAARLRGHDDIAEELWDLERTYRATRRRMLDKDATLPSNPFSLNVDTGELEEGGVQTHYVDRPLGIPQAGESAPDDDGAS